MAFDGVAAVFAGAPRPRHRRLEGQPGQDRDAVVAFHAVHEHVAVAKRREFIAREILVPRLCFLQTQYVGLLFLEPLAQMRVELCAQALAGAKQPLLDHRSRQLERRPDLGLRIAGQVEQHH